MSVVVEEKRGRVMVNSKGKKIVNGRERRKKGEIFIDL